METTRIDLSDGWSLMRGDRADAAPMAARVPGSVQADLLAAGRIEDPFFGTNERDVQWVGQATWKYRRLFDAPELPGPGARAYLVFEGLDTFATVHLNGRPVGAADNMFRPWRFDVTENLAAGENELVVVFESAEARAGALAEAYGVRLPSMARIPDGPFVRKAQCQFGWDWGPTILTVGIWRPVRLEIVPRAWIDGIDAWGEPRDDGTATLGVLVEVEGPRPDGLALHVTAFAPDGAEVGKAGATVVGKEARLEIPVTEPQLWWPSGMGGQPLYSLRLSLRAGAETVDELTVRVGIRRLELVREADEWGRSFYFRVNGRPLFAKGANWIPADALPTRVTRGRYRRLLEDCAAAGMNMLRVWGGGFYEDPAFYEACDELGLLVWQDLMFSCAMYPGDEAFVASVRAETALAVRRLRRHTSLALWCGNNEIEWGWHVWGWKQKHPARLWQDYVRLFHEVLPAVCAAHDPRRPYVPSSPHGDGTSAAGEAGGGEEDANADSSGDAHVWTVWFGSLDGRTYGQSGHRFVSEFGFQALPPMRTLEAAIPAGEMRLDSPAMLQHQKSGDGNAKVLRAIREWFGEPRDFEALAYLSQAYQARTIRLGVEHWRRSAPRTMGALYWQANDCWPVISWAGLDYYGRWKALHYAARRFFAQYLVSGLADEQGARLWATADFGAEPLDARVAWTVYRWDGSKAGEGRRRLRLEPGATSPAAEVTWADLGVDPREVYVAAEIRRGRRCLSRTLLEPVAPAQIVLADPGLRVETADGRVGTVSAEGVALAVCLEAEGADGRFEDNFFDLLPGERRRVRFRAERKRRKGASAIRWKVRSLYDARAR